MIMIVTFHEEFRRKISSFLSEKGYEVCIPPHRQDVLPLVKEKSPLVVVLDMYVAEPSGLTVLRELRAQHYRGKVLVLAGTSVSPLISEAWHFGIEQVIGGFQGNSGSLNLEQIESAIKMSLHSDIAKRAFELYEASGHPHGNDLDDWLEAERQIYKRNTPLPSLGPPEVKSKPDRVSKKQTKTPKKSTRMV